MSDETDQSDEREHPAQSDHVHLTSSQSDQFGLPSDQSGPIRVGDRVRYGVGVRSMVRLCGAKQLEVVEVTELLATVKHW